MKMFYFKGIWYNPLQIVSIKPPSVGEMAVLHFSDGDEIELNLSEFSELKMLLDWHLIRVFRK